MRQRTDCAALAAGGLIRINRQPTDKPHAKVRPGDVITLAQPGPGGGRVRVLEVLALAARRGGSEEARRLYREVPPDAGVACNAAVQQQPCGADRDAPYRDRTIPDRSV
ncbi:MAG: hypothetical protein NT133_08225 [Alphaproteobacteria bacterium]|nr:hypothetical protein [Alphaproteobacteria bacterium]